MVKEENGIEKINKRSARTTEIEVAVAPVIDIYAKVLAYEESEAKARDADADAKLYTTTCKEIADLLQQIATIRLNGSEKDDDKIRDKQIDITTKIIFLKKLNRLEKVRTQECRQALQTYREEVDNNHLQLQNLVYEQLHLAKEVNKCYEFKSLDEEMELISIDEFFASAPASVSKPDITKINPHELNLARLTWELMQRKELSLQIKQFEELKKNFTKEIDEKKEQLNSLEPNLQTILDATKPLQETLNISLNKMKKMAKLAALLPRPLYILYVQADALGRLCKWLSVNIIGKADEVRVQEQHFDNISSDSESDGEKESSHRRKNISDRKKSGPGVAEQRKDECLRKHPLCVMISINLPSGSVSLQFQWLTALEIICVLPAVTPNSGVSASDILSPMSVLADLYPGDTGETCPNPASYYHLKRADLDSLPLNSPTIGIAYNWAQTICGLKYLSDSTSIEVDTCRESLEGTLRAVRKRILSRISLALEVKLLESGDALRDKPLQAVLSSFTSVSAADLNRVPIVTKLFETGLVDDLFLLYRACATLHDAKIVAYIALSPNYPKVLPIFALEFSHNQTLTAINSGHVRDLERELNAVCDEANNSSDILVKQVCKMLRCCEVFAATELSIEKPVKAVLFRSYHGRSRSHPYRFVDTAGGVFTHR